MTVKEYYDKYLKQPNEEFCPTCGKLTKFKEINTGYRKFCCPRCAQLSNETRQNCKETCLEKYGVENPYQSEQIKEKIKKTNLKRYGVEYAAQSIEIQQKCKQTKKERYGDENYNNREKSKQTCLERYGTTTAVHSEKGWKKAVDTMHKNGKRSSLELYLEKFFKDNNITYNYEYKEERYPYFCDFYLPDFDTFIEINGYWTHNDHWFNKNNPNDIKILKEWEKWSKKSEPYKVAIKVWTEDDVNKQKIAKKNKLNYIVLWDKNDIDNFIDNFKINF